ncbi:MAG: hypothetical protein AAB372_02895 [Patescibacteria group bacterium]
MNRYQTLAEFVTGTLPSIVVGEDGLEAIFCSYNAVGNHKSGLVTTRRSRLRLFVQNGHLDGELAVTLGVTAFLTGNARVATCMAHALESEAIEAQQKVERGITSSIRTEPDAKRLIFIYAGITAFEGAVSFACTMREQYTDAIVMVITCDCDLAGKTQKLDPLISAGTINHVIVTPVCGGVSVMGKLVEELVEAA